MRHYTLSLFVLGTSFTAVRAFRPGHPLAPKTHRASDAVGALQLFGLFTGAKKADSTLPGSLGEPPVFATTPPGNCIFGEEWSAVPLLSREVVTHDTRLFTFGLPEDKTLGLPTCGCILLKCGEHDGEPVVRPYTPFSANPLGKLELLVKIYPNGKATTWLEALSVGETVECKHIKFNVKIQYPFNAKKLVMLVGGTGIAPMIQALHAILGNPDDNTEVLVLFGNRSQNGMLARETLKNWEEAYPDQLRVVDVLSEEPEGSSWTGERGFINQKLMETYGVQPNKDTMCFVCGPPPMYKALCGARDDKELTGALADMGFSANKVCKF